MPYINIFRMAIFKETAAAGKTSLSFRGQIPRKLTLRPVRPRHDEGIVPYNESEIVGADLVSARNHYADPHRADTRSAPTCRIRATCAKTGL